MPLALSPDAPDAPVPPEQFNSFDYVPTEAMPDAFDDRRGYRCPIGAHIRRMNPRHSTVAGNSGLKRRIVRRGLPYGPPYDPRHPDDGIERGLLGLFIGVSLKDQFEFLMSDWVNKGALRARAARHTRSDPRRQRGAGHVPAPGRGPQADGGHRPVALRHLPRRRLLFPAERDGGPLSLDGGWRLGGAAMADIFVSYKREDRDRVEPLARALEREGFSVWWDPELSIGQSYASSIRTALNEAQAVIPVWTALSVQSEWVQEEATHAKRRGVLFPVRLDAVDPPIGFTMVETADLIDWQEGDTDHDEWSRLLRQLRAKLLSAATPPTTGGHVVIKQRRTPLQLLDNRMGSVAGGAAIVLAIIAALFLLRREPDGVPGGDDTAAATGAPLQPRDVAAPAVVVGANSSIAEARQLALGTAEPGAILTTDDTRVYAVPNALKVRDRAVVRLQNESTTLRPNLKIFNADRSLIADPYDTSPGASVQHELTLTPGQPIYVQVLPYNTIGKYKISVTPQRAYDAFEPNDTLVTTAAAKIGYRRHRRRDGRQGLRLLSVLRGYRSHDHRDVREPLGDAAAQSEDLRRQQVDAFREVRHHPWGEPELRRGPQAAPGLLHRSFAV